MALNFLLYNIGWTDGKIKLYKKAK